jgi:hypothetical protein
VNSGGNKQHDCCLRLTTGNPRGSGSGYWDRTDNRLFLIDATQYRLGKHKDLRIEAY